MSFLYKNTQKKGFSYMHNYYSPVKLYISQFSHNNNTEISKEYEFDGKINEYNICVQSFVNKRWTHKREICIYY